MPFPATEQADAPAAVPATLEVVRAQPEGAVGVAPFLTITFNQPMVPVGTIGQLAAADVPATISPAVDGRWQWIGTSTLRFDAATRDRLPMATDYTVTVPAGTRSASGAELAGGVRAARSPPRRPTSPRSRPTGARTCRCSRCSWPRSTRTSTPRPCSSTSRVDGRRRGARRSAWPPPTRSPPTRPPRPRSPAAVAGRAGGVHADRAVARPTRRST